MGQTERLMRGVVKHWRTTQRSAPYEDEDFDWTSPDGRRQLTACIVYTRMHGWDPEAALMEQDHPEDWATNSMIEEAMSMLSASDQDLLEAAYIDGATIAELAADFGYNADAIRKRLERARRRLKAAYLDLIAA